MKILDILSCITDIAPLEWQESYDNAGLIIGNPDDDVKKALVTLDVTDEVLEEAISGGSGSFLIDDAKAAKADAFVTANIKYHDYADADGKILLIDAGHFETEQFIKDFIAVRISEKNRNFAVSISSVKTNYIHYFV